MKTAVYEVGDQVRFEARDVSERYAKLLADDYYDKTETGYARTYPRDLPNIKVIGENFTNYAEDMFAHFWDNKPAAWQDALNAFVERISGANANWFVSGSCALTLRGIAVEPRGLDVIADMKDFDNIRRLFAEQTILPLMECKDWVAEAFGMIYIDAPISIAFGPQDCMDKPDPVDSGAYAAAHLEEIEWRGHTIKVPPVELLLNINRRRGRTERVSLIEAYMAAH